MRRDPLVVLKFGSSVLRSEADLPRAVHEIYRWLRRGHSVLAVVSAFGNTTDDLLASARRYTEEPQEGALALLLSTGEKRCAALLSLALDRAGICAATLDPARLGLRTSGRVLNAEPVRINVGAVRRALEQSSVVVVPGFIGQMQDGSTSLLGRGGSDLSALFLAAHLNASRCRLLKDVGGVYESDPNLGRSRRYRSISWDDAVALGGRIVQSKALRFAREHNLRFEVAGLGEERATTVGANVTEFYTEHCAEAPLRVTLLGLGTVGWGVYQELLAHPDLFEVVGVAAKHREKHDGRVPAHLFSTDIFAIAARECDVVIELIGGVHPAVECIAAALEAGKHVVSANKAAIAQAPNLHNIARRNGVKLLYSAAVGGAVPVLEQLEQLAQLNEICAIDGVLNGTTNFILHEVARGIPFEQAVASAQAAGLAEADPSSDLDGSDVACKLVLIARACGVEISLGEVRRTGITEIDPRHVFDLSKSGSAVRLVGSIRRASEETQQAASLVASSGPPIYVAEVKPAVLEASHPLARTRREDNCVVVEFQNGEKKILRGKGAGRWPTTESVLADLFTLVHQNSRTSTHSEEAAEAVAS
ncbi:MAG TPA: homoserine dehydrogenase [Terriglobales bacterium]|nr:homoserine dehydrogenase [Terriglobales bacterium]